MKTLIFAFAKQLAPVGGPRGYLYNLSQEIIRNNDNSIEFIEEEYKYEGWKERIRSVRCSAIRNVITQLKNIYKYWLLLKARKHPSPVDFSLYDFIHFHSSVDMYSVRDALLNYRGKVILTSHSPTLLSNEIWEGASIMEKLAIKIFGGLRQVDMFAFNRADYLIFPCPEAEEPYLHSWDGFAEFKAKNKDKFRYLLTGITPCMAKCDRKGICEKYGVPQDGFILCYVGRHNNIKGYDLLKDFAEKILEKYENAYFLIAGRETPFKGLDHKHWIEVGWTNDPHSIIAASDVFVLPNRETYFDLVLLEVLSLGKIVIASNTGGNKHFADCESVFLYDGENEFLKIVEKLMQMSIEDRNELANNSRRLYDENFTCERFYKNYKDILSNLNTK